MILGEHQDTTVGTRADKEESARGTLLHLSRNKRLSRTPKQQHTTTDKTGQVAGIEIIDPDLIDAVISPNMTC